ncbi:MAG: ABC transporter ATP-binding protein [Lachnospiraceae bacterium]|nr:ABC transporter ATP-binding protein [Lachnospiraceae bacterium]
MFKILKKMTQLLDGKQKSFMVLLVFLMLIGAILEAFSVAVVVPVITLVVDSEAIAENALVSAMYRISGMESERTFAVSVMLLLIFAFILKNVYLYFQQKILYHFVYTNQFRTSERMMRNYLRRGYEFYLSADTAVVQRSITSDVNNMYALILAVLQLVSEGIIFVTLACVSLVKEPLMTLIIAALLVITLLVIKVVLKPIMYKAGKENQDYYSGLFKWISQTVTGIKEVKIGGKERYFVDAYSACGKGYVGAVQKYTLFNNMPRLIIETMCVAGVVIYFIIVYLTGGMTTDIFTTITLLGIILVRLMPCANRINNQLNNISYFEPFFMGVSDNLQDEIDDKNVDMSFMEIPKEKLPVKKEITIKDVHYKYPNTEKWVLEGADLTIPVGSAVGIVGSSGAGKSTIVDVMLGLLELQKGDILADGVSILEKENYRKWLKNVGYIPQTIFMLDDTIRRNIAFGVSDEEIDEERIWTVLKEAQLDEFVKSLPEGLDTGIGERGIRLSGGQRQRIGIARALYEDPEVLVLDEATSALDNDTEKAIMESINRLHGNKTLVIIAHRLQTIEKCDAVYRIENGKAVKER